MDVFGDINKDLSNVLTALNLDVGDMRSSLRTRSIAAKKAMVYCYLRIDKGYSLQEIGDITHKDHSTVLYAVSKHKNTYKIHRQSILNKTQAI